MAKKIFVVGGADYYANWIKDCILVNNVSDADIVFFTGGEDVDPSLYDCHRHETTFSNIDRDLEEKRVFDDAVAAKKKLILGVCRGSQFLCVMNGGMLIQDCSNHAIFGTHDIVGEDEKVYPITSTHHQMQYPFNLPNHKYKILYWTTSRKSMYYAVDPEKQSTGKIFVEPEIVLYHTNKNTKCLAIQGHPEMMREGALVHGMLNELIDNLLNEKA